MPRKKTNKPAQKKTSFAPRQPRSNFLVGIPVMALALALLLGMADFLPEQSGRVSQGVAVSSNLMGEFGVFTSYWLFWLLGLSAWLVPLMLLRLSGLLLLKQAQKVTVSMGLSKVVFLLAVAGVVQMLAGPSASELSADASLSETEPTILANTEPPVNARYSFNEAGGAVGQLITHQVIRESIGPAGIGITLAAMLILSGFFAFREALFKLYENYRTARQIARKERELRQREARLASQPKPSTAKAPEKVAAVAPPSTKQATEKERKTRTKKSLKSAGSTTDSTEPDPSSNDDATEPALPEPPVEVPEKKTRSGFLLSRKKSEDRQKPPPPKRTKPLPPDEPAKDPDAETVEANTAGPSVIQYGAVEKADVDLPDKRGDYVFPKLELLATPPAEQHDDNSAEYAEMMRMLVETLEQFKVQTLPGEIHTGPVITRYEVTPAPGVRVEKIANLDKNIALSLKAMAVRILAPVPGKGTVGIEVPNRKAQPVYLREIVESAAWVQAKAEIPVVLGKDVTGKPIVEDLTRMPHMLIAGATGAGKTVCINTVIASLLFHSGPDDLRFIMVDPKVVEMQVYNDLPHMLIPVVTEPKKVPGALKYLISEMERRYQIFAEVGVRNIAGFNAKMVKDKEERKRARELDKELSSAMSPEERAAASVEVKRDAGVAMETPTEKMPYIVCIIDELADLMMVAPQDIETGIARLAQLARAAGIHLILATQRPSVNVITGVIKANLPTRISFKVSSQVDSRTILDQKGAETLIGKGDMLFVPPGASSTVRAQGAFVSDDEINGIVEFLKANNEPPQFDESVQAQVEAAGEEDGDGFTLDGGDADGDAALLKQAIQVIKNTNRASTSSIQRRLKIGYNRAARIMDRLEDEGIVGPDNGSKPRDILVDIDSL